MLKINNLNVSIDSKNILNGITCSINSGDIVALLGPNGHGKSTLFHSIMGNPHYVINKGKILFNGEDITSIDVSSRSKKGIFLAFQNPPEISGVMTLDFFKNSLNSHLDKPIKLIDFYKKTTEAYSSVGLDSSFIERNLNEGFSGGEKKRNEIIQLQLLNPSLAMLDEIDSGLDVDALSNIADVINNMHKKGTTFIIISHYDRLFKLVKPNKTFVIINGKIALEGDSLLAERISKEGYSFIEKEYKIKIEKKDSPVSIGECGVKQVIK